MCLACSWHVWDGPWLCFEVLGDWFTLMLLFMRWKFAYDTAPTLTPYLPLELSPLSRETNTSW